MRQGAGPLSAYVTYRSSVSLGIVELPGTAGMLNDSNEMPRMREDPHEYARSPGGSLGSAVRMQSGMWHANEI
jgi:hypothetical protein